MPKIKISTAIATDRDRAFEVIRDLEQYPQFMKDVKSVKVIERDGDRVVSEWKTDIDGTPIEWVEEDVFDNNNKTVRFVATKGDYRYSGAWLLEKTAENSTRVSIEAHFDWESPKLEQYYGHVFERKARLALKGMLYAVKKRATAIDKFAFIAHPYDIDVFAEKVLPEPGLAKKNRRLVERTLRWCPPMRRKTVMVRSKTGKVIQGEIIVVPLICEQILKMDGKIVLKKTLEAANMARKLGAKIVGLGAYMSGVGRKGILVAKGSNMPTTTGISYTIATAIDATLKAASEVGINLSKSKVTIIGATGNIGKICSNVLVPQVASLTLVARNEERLKAFHDQLKSTNPRCDVKYDFDARNAVKDSDIVILSTNTPSAILSAQDLPAGCVVCDVSVPHNISREEAEKNNILVIDGGLVRVPSNVNFDYLALPENLAYACLSEVMILTFEGIFESYSIGGDIQVESVLKIKELAEKHGFQLGHFRSFGKLISKEQIENIKKVRLERSL